MATMYRPVNPSFLQKTWQTNYNGHVETNDDAALQYQVYLIPTKRRYFPGTINNSRVKIIDNSWKIL